MSRPRPPAERDDHAWRLRGDVGGRNAAAGHRLDRGFADLDVQQPAAGKRSDWRVVRVPFVQRLRQAASNDGNFGVYDETLDDSGTAPLAASALGSGWVWLGTVTLAGTDTTTRSTGHYRPARSSAPDRVP
jgi:hypothetical protein